MPQDDQCRSGFPCETMHFTAGFDDTRVKVPTFVGLRCKSNSFLPRFYIQNVARAYKRSHRGSIKEALSLVEKSYAQHFGRRLEGDDPGGLSFATPVFKSEDFIAVEGFFNEPVLSARKFSRGSLFSVRDVNKKGESKQPTPRRHGLPAGMIDTGVTAGNYSVSIDMDDYIESLYRQPWLGILYEDELNVRPCGPVLGRMVSSLGLSPLETVTLRTKSWTTQETETETTTERELERTIELSSEISSSLSNRYADEWRQEMGYNVAPKLGGSFKGLDASVGTSLDLSAGHTKSAELKRDSTQKISRSAALRAKQNHKTSVTVATETGAEAENTRVVQNVNPDRTMQLRYYKVLEKQKVSLERRGAHMALRLCLDDPLKSLRSAVLEELAKLNPEISAEDGPTVLEPWKKELEITAYAPPGWEIGNAEGTVDLTVVLPPNHVLTSMNLEFVRAINEDGEVAYRDAASYLSAGGSFGMISPVPTVGTSGELVFRISINFAEPSWWINGSDINTVELKLSIGATPTTEYDDEARQRRAEWVEAETERRRRSFSLGKLAALVDTDTMLKDVIWAAVLERFFLGSHFWLGSEPSCDKLSTLQGWFCWDMGVVEFMPWWMSPKGHAMQEELNQHFPFLDPDTIVALKSWPFLSSPAAVVYLPIKHGAELDVLAHLLGGPLNMITPQINTCVQAFRAFHEESFGSKPRDPVPLEEGPGLCHGTPLGAQEWANAWEKPRKRALLLDEWFETMPTDGLHVEVLLGDCDAVSPRKAAELDADTRVANAAAALDEASAAEKNPAFRTDTDADTEQ